MLLLDECGWYKELEVVQATPPASINPSIDSIGLLINENDDQARHKVS